MSTNDDAKALIEQSMSLQAKALALMGSAAPAEPALLTTREAVDAALAGTSAILRLSTSLAYNAPLRLTRPVTLISETYEARQQVMMTRDEPAPRFLQGIRYDAEHVGLFGLDVTVQPGSTLDIIQGYGNYSSIERLRAIGDKGTGAKRGVHYHGGSWVLRRSVIDEIRRVGQDTQAVYQQEMTPPYGGLVEECELWAAGQSIMIGGGDPPDMTQIPQAISVRRSKLLKQDAWYTEGWQIKCALELKDVVGFSMSDCDLQGAGTSQGQGAYLIVLTPRNQSGGAPFSTVQNVMIERIRGRQASGVCTMLGYDPTLNKPSGPLLNVTMRQARFTEIDPLGITRMGQAAGSGRLFYMDRRPQQVTLEAITVEGQNIAAVFYAEHEPPTGMVLRNWKMPPSRYGFHTPLGSTVSLLKQWAPDAVVEISSADIGATEV